MKYIALKTLAKEHGVTPIHLQYKGDSILSDFLADILGARVQMFFNITDPNHRSHNSTVIYQY